MLKQERTKIEDAVETIESVETGRGVVLVCEHASLRIPEPWQWPASDAWILGTHWSFDIGVADLVRYLCAQNGCGAVLSRFSRLLIDPNRPPNAPTLIRRIAEGRILSMNDSLTEEERTLRMEKLWVPYHSAARQLIQANGNASIVGMHSFTRDYEGSSRAMEVGVLFDEDQAFGEWAAEWLQKAGLRVALNEPYSGRNGLMYSPQFHASENDRHAIELEFRQDLLSSSQWCSEWFPVLGQFIAKAASWAATP
jgi:predicted N-formylglutamate amidohydrolase